MCSFANNFADILEPDYAGMTEHTYSNACEDIYTHEKCITSYETYNFDADVDAIVL